MRFIGREERIKLSEKGVICNIKVGFLKYVKEYLTEKRKKEYEYLTIYEPVLVNKMVFFVFLPNISTANFKT